MQRLVSFVGAGLRLFALRACVGWCAACLPPFDRRVAFPALLQFASVGLFAAAAVAAALGRAAAQGKAGGVANKEASGATRHTEGRKQQAKQTAGKQGGMHLSMADASMVPADATKLMQRYKHRHQLHCSTLICFALLLLLVFLLLIEYGCEVGQSRKTRLLLSPLPTNRPLFASTTDKKQASTKIVAA